ncbi:Fe-containing alcohol dehydrogenase [Sporothrix schenckii 1099-18]|uniref:Fe-containing alcohol dehydrogenase n=1 Tax=Sporothrix schenckii 1099-18 TaxID=1397361 RepID=A0A0F2MHB5_SPOSC|nr:Fe-containing alcohol dehydrogenase [Sporothrix schenckii 1099-18]KJR87561.1 Fe-containing alcohol dehydrogenase [Sporothrix schenckii 1099-18]
MSSDTAVFQPAFTEPPGTNLVGIPVSNLTLPSPYVAYGRPYDELCAKHVRETFKASRVYIVVSKSLAANTDRLDRLVAALQKSNIAVVGVRKGITPHTPWTEILSIAAECRAAQADCVVTLGAGSTTDGAKLVVLCLANDIREPTQLARYSVESTDIPKDVRPPTVPLVTIPTSLSGGEYFSLAGGTDDTTAHKSHKYGFLHSGMGAKLIILDAALATLTPAYHWLSTGVRSVDHCVEALCCLTATPAAEDKAERGLRLLVPSLLRCKNDDKDVAARHRCQMAVNLAMDNIRAGIPMGGSHAIGHQLGPLGVPHGVTSCIMCAAVMKYNIRHGAEIPDITARQKKVATILWSEPEVAAALRAGGLAPETADLGDLIGTIVKTLGLPRFLNEVGIGRDIIPNLSVRALEDFWAPTNPVPLVKPEQVTEILEAVAG